MSIIDQQAIFQIGQCLFWPFYTLKKVAIAVAKDTGNVIGLITLNRDLCDVIKRTRTCKTSRRNVAQTYKLAEIWRYWICRIIHCWQSASPYYQVNVAKTTILILEKIEQQGI